MRKTLIGVVTSDKRPKTRRVEVERLYRHPKYGKIVKARTVCHVHDEENTSLAGDSVEIAECRPRSALKRWELVRVVNRANEASGQELPAETGG
ncbi:MAG: 30S ribosomal protein S17 [Planctomyces sp.]|nr:30S ribosomal protein S17 [Planctomyces sp.]